MSITIFFILYGIIGVIFCLGLLCRFAYKFKNSNSLQYKYQYFENYISTLGYNIQLFFTLVFWPMSLLVLLGLAVIKGTLFIIKYIFKIN